MSVPYEVGEPPNRRRTNTDVDPEDNMGFGDQVVDLEPRFDFGPEAARRREESRRLDVSDTYRELRRASERAPEVAPLPEVQGLVAAPAFSPDGTGLTYVQPKPRSFFVQQAQQLLRREEMRRKMPDGFDGYKSVNMLIDMLEQDGIDVTSEELAQIINFGVLNDAADKVIAASEVGSQTDIRNVYLTLQEADPILASVLPDVVAAKIETAAADAFSDPNIVQKAADKALQAFGVLIEPFVLANDAVQNALRAGQYNTDINSDGLDIIGAKTLVDFYAGVVSPNAYYATRKGQYNQDYIQEIKDSGEYAPIQVQVMLDIHRATVMGTPDPIISTLVDKYAGNELALPYIRDLIYNKADGNSQELMRQINSAHLGSTGMMLGGAAEDVPFDPARGSKGREVMLDATAMVASLILDPTLVGAKAVRIGQVMKYSISRLAPGAKASDVIRKMRLGTLEVSTPTYRYWNAFANDLNDLDAAEAAGDATRAAGIRNRMTRQYDEMPEDLIEDIRTSPYRGPDGKFTPESIAGTIDDLNDAYTVTTGEIADRIAVESANREVLRQAALDAQLMDDQAEALAKLREVDEATRKIKQLEKEQAGLKSVSGRIASTTKRRDVTIPRMSLIRSARMAMVNQFALATSKYSRAAKIVDEHLQDAGEPGLFAQSLSDNAVAFGHANREYKFGTTAGIFDSFNRQFASLATGTVISLDTAADAQQVYRYARQFLPKRTSEIIADAFRRGDIGTRRLLLSGLVRSAAASRGLTITRQEGDHLVRDLTPEARSLVTGTMDGEAYGVWVPAGVRPSEKAAMVADHKVRRAAERARLKKQGLDEDELKAAMDEFDADFEMQIDSQTRRSLSADSDGVQHALHLGQTVENIRLPNLREFEELRNPLRVKTGKGLERITNAWSVGTLYGLRFSMRNAVEEIGLYWLLGGGLMQLYRGRRLDQAIRKARPRLKVDPATGQIELQTSLGMVANKAEWVSRWMKHKGYPEWMAEMVFKQADPETLKAAGLALAQGDSSSFAQLAVEALGSQKVFGVRTNLTSESNKLAFKYLVDSTHGMSLLDEISEAGAYLNSGGYPIYASRELGATEGLPGIVYGELTPVRFGAYTNVPPKTIKDGSETVYGFGFWFRNLQETLDGDGPIGEAAVRLLNNPAAAKAEIARIIREDDTWQYKERFSRIRSDADIDQFADDYFENVFQHFTKQDGTVNQKVRDFFMRVDDSFVTTQEPIRKVTESLAKSGKVSDEYVFHTTNNLDIIENGLQRGGIAGGPLMEQGYGEVIHVFRKSDFPEDVVFGDVTLTPGWQNVTPPKPVASFTYRQIDVDPDDLPIGARGQELGYSVEEVVDLTESELKSIAALEAKIQNEIRQKYSEGNEFATFWDEVVNDAGETVQKAAVSKEMLADIRVKDRPDYIFGRETIQEPLVPFPTHETQLLGDRAFGWMGRQNARISRSPLFIANYLDQFEKTAEARRQFAAALAKRRGDDAPVTDADIELANRMYAQQSMDTAYNLTISYIDNPANRSNLAWKVRNFSRYYRATEDFYRRVQRTVTKSPESVWKGALVYNLLGENGFTFENDQGDMYFAYPGNELVQKALTTALGENQFPILEMFGIEASEFAGLNPFSINGKVLGLSPSLDMAANVPSVMGPITAPLAAYFGSFPALAGLRSAVLGKYSQPTGNVLQDVFQSILPAGVLKTLRAADPEWVESSMANAAMDTMAIMAAEGMLDELTVNGEPMLNADGTPAIPGLIDDSRFKQSDQWKNANLMATSLSILRWVGGFTVPAFPQGYTASASDFAKRYGIDSMDDAYYTLLDKYKDDPLQFEKALAVWYKMQAPTQESGTFGNWTNLMPFTLSSTKYNVKDQATASIAQVRATDDVLDWYRSPETEELFDKVGDATWWLAPKTGEFDVFAHALLNIQQGIRIPKTESERFEDFFAINGQVEVNRAKRAYDKEIAEATTADQVKRIKERRKKTIDDLKSAYPSYALVAEDVPEGRSNVRLTKQLNDVQSMLNFLKERDGKLSDTANALQESIKIYNIFKNEISGLQGTNAEKRAKKAELTARMDKNLSVFKEESPQAKRFIEAVLEADPQFILEES